MVTIRQQKLCVAYKKNISKVMFVANQVFTVVAKPSNGRKYMNCLSKSNSSTCVGLIANNTCVKKENVDQRTPNLFVRQTTCRLFLFCVDPLLTYLIMIFYKFINFKCDFEADTELLTLMGFTVRWKILKQKYMLRFKPRTSLSISASRTAS